MKRSYSRFPKVVLSRPYHQRVYCGQQRRLEFLPHVLIEILLITKLNLLLGLLIYYQDRGDLAVVNGGK